MPRKPFLPLSMSGTLFPLGDLGIESGTFLDKMGLDRLGVDVDETAGELTLSFRLIFVDEVALAAPGMDDLAFVIGPDEGRAAFPFSLTVGNRFELAIEELKSLLRVPATILSKANNTGSDTAPVWVRVPDEPYEIDLPPVSFRVDGDGNVALESELRLDINPCFIGDTGCVFKAEGISLHLTSEETPPPGRPDGWRGLLIDEARFYLPEDFALGDVLVRLDDAGVGNGGVFGTISLVWTNTLREEEPYLEGPATGTLFGIHMALKEIALTFEQNVPVSSLLRGEILVPFFNKAIGMKLALAMDGDFTVDLYAAAGSGDSANLIALELDELLRLSVKSAQFSRIDERALFSLAGDVKPLIGGFDWPTFEIEKLSVDEDGNFDIQGGWIDLPETFSLDFHAFKVDIDEIGLGKNEETAREWFGFSGGIRLVEGVPLSASVDGLQVSWDPADPPTSSDPLHGVQVTLEGVAVHLEIPGTLVLDGSVRYREIPRPPDTRTESDSTAAQAGLFGHVFTGSISLNITAINTQVAGELLIGELTQYAYDDTGALVIGETFPAFYIVLSVQLPSGIPLGATGTGLYGLAGLFGLHVAPNRQLVEDEPEAWYEWYKADRGDQSAYSVTKVIKWEPRYDNYAFGAGLTIGTIYDDGFTINVGALVAILLPGPVIMIEGKANLLKQRGESGKSAEGALYALIVFDGLAETFQMNVDINYTLEDVITVGGGMEAFFDFNDNSLWYIYIGRKDPETKRIRAEVISIISASAYFMVDPKAIVFGAAAGLDLKLEYQPLVIRLILRIAFEIGLFFKQPQLTGFVELYGEISILIFGWGIKLILQTLLEGSAPQPWWIHGLARVEVSLPFPLPSFEAQVEFTWGESEQPARVPLLLGASAIHPKELGRSWTLATTHDDAPIVPVDAIAVLSLGKPLSQVSTRRNPDDGTLQWFDYETVEGWEFRYDLSRVVLREADSGTVVAEGPLDTHRPWLNPLGRILTDAGPSDSPDAPPVASPQVQLWGYSPLDALSPGAQSHYRDACDESAGTPERHCVDWKSEPVGLDYGRVFTYRGLAFSTTSAIVHRIGVDQPFLKCQTIEIRFPEPITSVDVHCSGLSRATARLRGREVFDRSFSNGHLVITETLDSLRLTLATGPGTVAPNEVVGIALFEICYETQRSVDQIPPEGTLANDDRAGQIDAPLLKPDTLYALEVVAERGERVVGEGEFSVPEPETATYYFRTGAPPGLNSTTTQIEAATSLSATERDALMAIDFRDGRLNELTSYVQRTTPAHGAPSFHGGYDVVVRFDVPYLTALFDGALTLRIRDQNGRVVVGDASSWIPGLLPLITPGLAAFLGASREQRCANAPKPWSPHIPHELVCSLPETLPRERLYRAELMADGKVLHGFAFSLSRFRDFKDHFAPGWDSATEAHRPTVRSGISFASPPSIDIGEYQSHLGAWLTARERLAATLTFGEHDSGVSLEQALSDMTTTRGTLDEFMLDAFTVLDTSAQPSFEAAGLSHRPRPPKLELVAIETGTDVVYLLESAEPVERARLSVVRVDTGTPVIPLWNDDGTRAYLLDSSRASGAFVPEPVELELSWTRGGITAPDVTPLYREGSLDSAIDSVRWTLSANK